MISWQFIRSIPYYRDISGVTGAYIVPKGMIALRPTNRRPRVAPLHVIASTARNLGISFLRYFAFFIVSFLYILFIFPPAKVTMQVVSHRDTYL
jgi:hypothetical protein